MSQSHNPSASETESTPGPADRDEDPFSDDDVTAVLDSMWDDLTS
jgi:hypothetical protein